MLSDICVVYRAVLRLGGTRKCVDGLRGPRQRARVFTLTVDGPVQSVGVTLRWALHL